MKKKIAIVCNYQLKNNRIGSMDRFFLAFNKACIDKGYVVDWFFSKSKKIELYNKINLYSDCDSNIETLFLNHIHKAKASYNYVFTHFIELFTPFYKEVKSKLDCKIIAVDHMSRPIEGFSLKKKIKRKIKYFINSKHIDKVVAVSEYIKSQNLKDYSKRLKDKIEVVYNGIEIDLYKASEGLKNDNVSQFRCIVVSHLVYEKGIQDLIFSLNKLDKHILDKITVDVYGEGVYKKVLLELITKFALEKVVSFKGSIPDVYTKYRNYNFMIQPTYMEAFSLSILESLCCNVPVITTAVGGNIEIVKHGINGFLFEPKNIVALKNILTQVCDNNLTLENTNICAEIKNKYALDIMVNNYLKLI